MSGRHMWYKQYFSKKFKVSCLKQGSDTNDLCPRNWANDLPMRRPTLHQLKQCILGRNHIASTPFAAIVILCRSPYITLELGLGRVELVHFGFKASFLSETKYKQDNFNFAKWRLKRPILCPPYAKVPIEEGKYNKPPLCFNVLNKFDNRWVPDNRH